MNELASQDSRAGAAREGLRRALEQLNGIILGKERPVRLAVTCLLAGGHLLIEDIPGVGKTTLAHALARTLGLTYRRIQFTSDLLPADILGTAIFDRERNSFVFRPGPIFTQLVLADEVNRATPKTQSALLEAMEEHQVTTENETHALPQPFFVIATQNPAQQIGTFPLPESQLDRFLMRIALGYPPEAAERALLEGRDRRELLRELEPALRPDDLARLRLEVERVHTAPALMDYIQTLVRASREAAGLAGGLSPRAALALRRAAQAWALIDQRRGVEPEDVQAVFTAVAGHRLVGLAEHEDETAATAQLLQTVPVP
jgi:MoxR-like ATPase